MRISNLGNKMDKELMEMLQKLEKSYGIPLMITSGYRTEEENKKCGGVKTSSHLTGNAVDIKVVNSRMRWMILSRAIEIGFNRIGIGKDFIHLDNDKSKIGKLIWNYEK